MLKLAFLLWSSEIKWKSFQGLVSQKLFQGSLSHELSPTFRLLPLFWLNEMTILSKESKPDNFESRNSLKLNFTNIRGLLSNFVGCESFLESNSPDILAYCETNLDDSIDSGNIFRLFQTILLYAWLCSLCEGGTFFSTGISLENSQDSYSCFLLASLLHSVSCFCFLYRSPYSSLYTVFDAILSNFWRL